MAGSRRPCSVQRKDDRMVYCGWDGGGTKTRMEVISGDGRHLSEAVFGPLNLNGASEETVLETVKQAVGCMRETCVDGCGGLVVGMAGVSNREAAEFVREAIRGAGYSGPLCLVGDHEIALAGAVEGPGAILIAGTGSVLYGRDPEGRLFRAGGWGYLIDDDGSGYAIGRDILRAVVRACDGRNEKTVLTELVLERLQAQQVQDIITWLYAPQTGKKEIASLATLLFPALKDGDASACRIRDQAANDLAALVLSGWKHAGMRSGELVFTGSVLEQTDEISQRVWEQVQQAQPEICRTEAHGTPAWGAACMARQQFSMKI